MMPSGLLRGACGALSVFWLLLYCLLLLGAQGAAFELQVEPRDLVLPAGGSLTVNCSTDCPSPKLITLETSLSKDPVDQGLGWAAFQISNVTSDHQILCSGYCNGSQMIAASGITVYGFPERVELAPLPAWQPVGENLTLRCLVVGGEPRKQLTAVLLRGQEELSRQPVVGEPAEVMATVLAGRGDHGANFSCRTELDLRSQGLAVFHNTSAARQLRTFALPRTPPRLAAPLLLEVGRSRPVNCSLDGLFPASEARVQMALGDQMLNATVLSDEDTLWAMATATAREDQEGSGEIVCYVTLGGKILEARENLTVFSFLGPILNLSESNITDGSTVNVTCTAGPRVQVMLDGASTPPLGRPAQLQLRVTESDDGRDFFCNATLEVDGVTLHRNTTAQLRVLYGPRIDRAKCPQHLAWKDRTTHVLQCQARGNPAPQLQCLQEGSSSELPIGIPFLVKLKHNGTYRCQAVSPRGVYTLLVMIDVQNRNPRSISIVIGVLAILGVVTVAAALMYVFGVQKRSGTYHVKHPSPSIPLTSMQSEETAGEEVS